MDRQAFSDRTRLFAVATLRFAGALPASDAYRIVGRQLMRAATSVGANYRAACRARSRNEFVAKLGIVEEEADEARYWLDVLRDLDDERRIDHATLDALHREAGELLAMVVASIKTARSNR